MIIYFDTETTGLTPGNICQLSYIKEDKNNITSKNFFFEVDFVEYSAQAIHGFSKEKLQKLSSGRRFFANIEEIYEDFSASDLIVAHNLPFDLKFLISEFENNGWQFKYKDGFCSMRNFTPICKIPRANNCGYKYPKLNELYNFLELSEYDVSMTSLKLFKNIFSGHDARYDTVMLYLSIKEARQKFTELNTYFNKFI